MQVSALDTTAFAIMGINAQLFVVIANSWGDRSHRVTEVMRKVFSLPFRLAGAATQAFVAVIVPPACDLLCHSNDAMKRAHSVGINALLGTAVAFAIGSLVSWSLEPRAVDSDQKKTLPV